MSAIGRQQSANTNSAFWIMFDHHQRSPPWSMPWFNHVESSARILCNLFPFTTETFVKMNYHQVVHKEENKVPSKSNQASITEIVWYLLV
jgi:hypothetical protein